MNWNLYYNREGTEQVCANLVYTPYVSDDGKTFCMSFNRDPEYHKDTAGWTKEVLEDRFQREIVFRDRASLVMPTLPILEIDYKKRRIYFAWPGDDFYMQSLNSSYSEVLPDWQEQWVKRIEQMWSVNITKMSLHPNSWTVHNEVLIPFNWFFSYNSTDTLAIKDVAIQISEGRQDKLNQVLDKLGMDTETAYSVRQLQKLTFNSFRSNYPDKLIDRILKEQEWQ
jgi:hypothetical protein